MADNPIEGEIVDTAPPPEDRDYMPTPAEVEQQQAETDAKSVGVIAAGAMLIRQHEQIVRFRNKPMILITKPFPHYTVLHKERFDRVAYALMGGVTRARVADLFAFLSNTSEDMTDNQFQILFGVDPRHMDIQADTDLLHLFDHKPRVWDMESLSWVMAAGEDTNSIVWRSPYPVIKPYDEKPEPVPFVMSLAGGDQGVYDDIMQSLAPLLMAKKPDGVIWWVGDGANGKSTLMDAIYKIFPGQLSSLTVKALTDARDTVNLNGNLANVVKESSEGRIEDTEIYKAVGTHENFSTHKFHSQETVEINGNMHHIFSANAIPTFNDKGFSARRRTFIVPFNQTFASDPNFEAKTFTPQMFGQLIAEMARYAVRLRQQNYRYKWSATTLAAKAQYDTDANNAEVYTRYLVDSGVVAFDGYDQVKRDYDNWCAEHGFLPLGLTNFRRAVQALGFERQTHTTKDNGQVVQSKMYKLAAASGSPLAPVGGFRLGLYTMPGFQPEPEIDVKTAVPDFEEPAEPEEPEQMELETENTTTTTTASSIIKNW